MTKKEAITIVACFFLWLFTLLLQGANCEFRWMWLQISMTLALPTVLFFILFKRIFRIKSIWKKLILIPISILGILYLAFLYIWFGTSVDATQSAFTSPNGQQEVIVKTYPINLLHWTHDFYRPVLCILKIKIDSEHYFPDEPSEPLEEDGFIAEWSNDDMMCVIRRNNWSAGKAYVETDTIRFH